VKGSHAVVWSGSRGACSSGCSRRRPSGASRRTISNGPENIAERELGRRQLTEDGNVEISEREVRRVSVRTPPRGASQTRPFADHPLRQMKINALCKL